MIKLTLALFCCLASSAGNGRSPVYEVNSHLAMTRAALTRQENLTWFLRETGLERKQFSSPAFERAFELGDDVAVGIWFHGRTASSLVEAGAVLEDGGGAWPSSGRFYRHFRDVQSAPVGFNLEVPTPILGLPLLVTRFVFPDSISWGSGNADAGGWSLRNEFSWPEASFYQMEALVATEEAARTEWEERLFLSIGHLVHLLQDCYQPSHTRNDPHAREWYVSPLVNESALEEYCRQHVLPGAPIAVVAPQYHRGFAALMGDAARYSGKKFFSDDTIFDKLHPQPDKGATRHVRPADCETIWAGRTPVTLCMTPGYVLSNELRHGDEPLKLARYTQSLRNGGSEYQVTQQEAKDWADLLVPRATAQSVAMIDYFFRGRLEAWLEGDSIRIKNVSAAETVGGNPADVTMGRGVLYFYYETASKKRKPLTLPIFGFDRPLAPDQTRDVPITNLREDLAYLEGEADPDERLGSRLIVVFQGVIGEEEGVAAGFVELAPVIWWCSEVPTPRVLRKEASAEPEVEFELWVASGDVDNQGNHYALTPPDFLAGRENAAIVKNGAEILFEDSEEAGFLDIEANQLACAGDGTLFFTTLDAPFSPDFVRLVKRTPDGTVTVLLTFPRDEDGLLRGISCVGADDHGNCYFTRHDSGAATLRNQDNVVLYGPASVFGVSPQGLVYVPVEAGGGWRILRIDPASLTQELLEPEHPFILNDIDVDAQGNYYFISGNSIFNNENGLEFDGGASSQFLRALAVESR